MNVKKSATELSLFFFRFFFSFPNVSDNILWTKKTNKKKVKKSHLSLAGFNSRCMRGGGGLGACMSHTGLGGTQLLSSQIENTTWHISCWAPCRRWNEAPPPPRKRGRVDSFARRPALKSALERGSRSARFSWWAEGDVLCNRIKEVDLGGGGSLHVAYRKLFSSWRGERREGGMRDQAGQ